MDMILRDRFAALWHKHFGGVELPICLYFTDSPDCQSASPPAGHSCLIGDLVRVRRGEDLCFDRDSVGCFGGKRYLGFDLQVRPNFEYFLSCGIPGKLEGERYKKSPQIVRDTMARLPVDPAPAPFAVFKRWDRLTESDHPAVVIFFASPDVLSGLFTLANFDQADPNAVIAPFGAGCATICQYPLKEGRNPHPRAVVGMFDVSARPFVAAGVLSFAVPMARFQRMVADMDESFLATESWSRVRRRIQGGVPAASTEE